MHDFDLFFTTVHIAAIHSAFFGSCTEKWYGSCVTCMGGSCFLVFPPLQSEHDTEARPILVTPSASVVEEVNASLRKRLAVLPTRDTAVEAVKKGFAVICKARD